MHRIGRTATNLFMTAADGGVQLFAWRAHNVWLATVQRSAVALAVVESLSRVWTVCRCKHFGQFVIWQFLIFLCVPDKALASAEFEKNFMRGVAAPTNLFSAVHEKKK